MKTAITRSEFLRLAAGAALCAVSPFSLSAASERHPLRRRAIPASGEPLPVIGVGTYRNFDISPADGAAWADCRKVLEELFAAGGSVIDSSPMYGRAEAAVGALLDGLPGRESAFIATKVWTQGRQRGIEQMQDSMRLLQRPIDLMQVHNLMDWREHLATLRRWKEESRIRYLGVTHYTASAYDQLEKVLLAEKPDFLQINYALNDREAERRILPLAREHGVAVLINRPFGGGSLLRNILRQPLPAWSGDYDCASWPQLLLKFCLSHPAVTCVIPGAGNPRHMADNLQAGRGREADQAFRKRLIDLL
ncbi:MULTISPECIES: aldo/keto reductase [Brenneria]|uniref:Aldo/keto reductase n=1 Tax=Brenneria nigrifluens DSM 30175 = ATCC 13028 TaxID=1121120 RepID=A0A2U1UFE9_9GAMM|nr:MULTISPECIES: aldo/keto reductase [Brenneria]EHD19988.1 aldo/keto reductase [Brenneria sp. EniD312]PWC20381.1 aldo/keto reductase [Brenneria nigrifluens] [Brenneria nigrifluens DSM 30175 = ATCC 13028]QCR03227.1 aldo/keto reductase [Brenneria nigrifluens] [Brenneria nigrifluens DSM 30175 = ATCC 13028]